MNRRLPAFLLLSLMLSLAGARAGVPPIVPLAEVTPTTDQERATSLITAFIQKYHFRKTPLDDALSAKAFERYLESLDPGRVYFTAADVESFARYRYRLDDFLRASRLEPAFELFRLYRTRVEERTRFAVAQLERELEFKQDEEYQFDRSKAPWAASQSELDEIWRKRVKNDVLTLRLAGDEADSKIRETLRKRYERAATRVAQLNSEDVYQLFMNAYAGSIEPHTAYFSPRTSENFRIRMSLSLEGIGAALQTDNEYTVVKQVIPGGPADKSGELKVEDRVTGVAQGRDGEMVDVVSWRLEDVVDLIRGPKDSVVRLQVLPKGSGPEGQRKVITLVRNRIELEEQAAKKSVIEAGRSKIGVIEIPTFYQDTGAKSQGQDQYRSTTRDVRRLLGELKRDGVAGVVVDLRGDGGGSLTEAIELTGLFIPSGPVVQVKDVNGKMQVHEDPDPGVAYAGPLAVLVDRYSASASEIFAGAIQDYGRGLVVGEPTFGKGTVQSLIDLDRFSSTDDDNLGQLKTTVAQFFRVNGSSTQHRGVVPDIVYPSGAESADQGERALENALPWATVQAARFSPVDGPQGLVPDLRERHLKRIDRDPGFGYLLEEAKAQKEANERTVLTLVETRRRAEQEAADKAHRERENRYRASRGLPPLTTTRRAADEDPDPEAEKAARKELGDPWLEEAAKILADLIDLKQRPAVAMEARPVAPEIAR